MIEELRRLERTRGRSAKDTIDHPPYCSDDIANSVAGAVNLIIAKLMLSGKAVPTGSVAVSEWNSNGRPEATLGKRSPLRDIDDEPPAKVHEVFGFRRRYD